MRWVLYKASYGSLKKWIRVFDTPGLVGDLIEPIRLDYLKSREVPGYKGTLYILTSPEKKGYHEVAWFLDTREQEYAFLRFAAEDIEEFHKLINRFLWGNDEDDERSYINWCKYFGLLRGNADIKQFIEHSEKPKSPKKSSEN